MSERFDDAAPLIAATAGCASIAVLLRLAVPPSASGPIALWFLFAALAIIAGIGAVASYALEEDLPPPVPRPSLARRVARKEPRPMADAADRRRPEDPADRVVARARIGPARLERPVWHESDTDREAVHPEVLSRRPPQSSAPAGRSGERTRAASPSDAIAEIDRLWADLEHLRRRSYRRPVG